MKRFILAVGLLTGFSGLTNSCIFGEKEEARPAVQYVQVRYQQTYCADPWGNTRDPQALAPLVRNYLSQRGIQANDVTAAAVNPPSVCLACGCTTGIVIEASVPQSDLQTLLDLRFQQI